MKPVEKSALAILALGAALACPARAEYLTNGSFDEATADGRAPAHWTIAADQKTVYRESAVLSADRVLEISRDHTTRTLWQPISGKAPKKLSFSFDATPLRYRVYIRHSGGEFVQDVYPGTRNALRLPEGVEMKEFMFRIETDGRPCTVALNNFSLVDGDNPLDLELLPYGTQPKTEGALARYEPTVFMTDPPKKYRVLVKLLGSQPVADLIAQDFARQFGWEADVIMGRKTKDPSRVQAAFDRGEYVLLVQGYARTCLDKPDDPIAQYVARGGKAVFFGSGRGYQFREGVLWVNSPNRPQNHALFRELPMYGFSPPDSVDRDFGIDVISEKAHGKGRVAQVSFKNETNFRSGLWPAIDECGLSAKMPHIEEKLMDRWADFYPAVYAKLMMYLCGDWVPGRDVWPGREEAAFDDVPRIKGISTDSRRFRADEKLAFRVDFERAPPAGVRLEFEAVDAENRLLARGTGTTVSFPEGMLQLPAVTVRFRAVNAASGHAGPWKGIQCYVADEDPEAWKRTYVAAGYLWIPLQYRPMFREMFREIGVNAENCWNGAGYYAMKDGMRWTDGWGGPIENVGKILAALQEQGIHGRKSYGDDPVKKHWKNACMSDEAWRGMLKTMTAHYAAATRENPPYQFALCDEMTHASPWLSYHAKDAEPCRLPACLERFRRRMREKYGSVDALNAKWGTSFASFDAVAPAVTKEARGNGGKYAGWVEFRQFMDDVMADASRIVTETLAENGSAVAGGQPNWCYRTIVTGVDPAKVCAVRTGSQDYGPEKVVGDLKRPGAPILSWVGYFDYHNIGEVVWRSLINGGTGLMLYATFQNANEWKEGYLTQYGAMSENGRKLQKVLKPLTEGLGDMLVQAPRRKPEAVLFDSQASMYVAWLEDDEPLVFDWNRRARLPFGPYLQWFRCRDHWERTLNTLRVPFVYASELDLEKKLAEAKTLILPESYAISAKARAAIAAFCERGGRVVCDEAAGLFDETGDRVGDGFAARLAGRSLRVACRDVDVNDAAFVAHVREALSPRPGFEILRAKDGKPANGLAIDVRELGNGSWALLTAGRAQDDGSTISHGRSTIREIETDLVLRLERPAYVRDLTGGRDFGRVAEVRWPAALGYRCFRVDPQPFVTPRVSVSGEMAPGKTLTVEIESDLPAVPALRVYDAKGTEQRAYRRNLPLGRKWTRRMALPLDAGNLPWRVGVLP